jgi:DNA-binding GntR family transcriptional regulator
MLTVPTKAEAAYVEVRWRILTGVLVPDTTMNQEAIARELGVSITPLREALRRLESEGLVRFVAHSTVRIPPLDIRELDELYAIRSRLDPFAAELAAANGSPELNRQLLKILDQPPANGQPDDEFKANRAFHRALYFASGNAELGGLLDHLWDRTERYRFVLVASGNAQRTSSQEHQALALAVAHRDVAGAAELMAHHVKLSHNLIRAVLTSTGARGRADLRGMI